MNCTTGEDLQFISISLLFCMFFSGSESQTCTYNFDTLFNNMSHIRQAPALLKALKPSDKALAILEIEVIHDHRVLRMK